MTWLKIFLLIGAAIGVVAFLIFHSRYDMRQWGKMWEEQNKIAKENCKYQKRIHKMLLDYEKQKKVS